APLRGAFGNEGVRTIATFRLGRPFQSGAQRRTPRRWRADEHSKTLALRSFAATPYFGFGPSFEFRPSDFAFQIHAPTAALLLACAASLQPGITAVTAGFFKHQAKAHCAIGTPWGTSVLSRSTSAKSVLSFSLSKVPRTSVCGNVVPGRYLPLNKPLASGTRASTPRLSRSACGK